MHTIRQTDLHYHRYKHRQKQTHETTHTYHDTYKCLLRDTQKRIQTRCTQSHTHTCTGKECHGAATVLTSCFRGIIEEMMTEWMVRTMPVNILTLVVMEGIFCLPKAGWVVRGFRGVHFSLNICKQNINTQNLLNSHSISSQHLFVRKFETTFSCICVFCVYFSACSSTLPGCCACAKSVTLVILLLSLCYLVAI